LFVAYNLVGPYSNQLVLDRDLEIGGDIQNATILTGGEYNLTVILDIWLTAAYANLTMSVNLGHADTIEYYNERRELLLNYSILEKKIGRILERKEEVQMDDLGVSEKISGEYLKLYLHSHFKETPLQEMGDSLRRIG
jgi:hypothetical protein